MAAAGTVEVDQEFACLAMRGIVVEDRFVVLACGIRVAIDVGGQTRGARVERGSTLRVDLALELGLDDATKVAEALRFVVEQGKRLPGCGPAGCEAPGGLELFDAAVLVSEPVASQAGEPLAQCKLLAYRRLRFDREIE